MSPDDPKWRFDERFYLQIVDATGADDIPHDPRTERLQIARLALNDIARYAMAQQKARAFRKTGLKNGRGTMEAHVQSACRDSSTTSGPTTGRIYMKVKQGGDFFPVTPRFELAAVTGHHSLDALPLCNQP